MLNYQRVCVFFHFGSAILDLGVFDAPTSPGTNNPSRLFFASLFTTRSHADDAILVSSVTLQAPGPRDFRKILPKYSDES